MIVPIGRLSRDCPGVVYVLAVMRGGRLLVGLRDAVFDGRGKGQRTPITGTGFRAITL